MNNRTRIINTVLMKEIDRQPFTFCFGPWHETLVRWRNEGLGNRNWNDGLNLDSGFRHVNVNLGYCPAFEHEVLEERESTYLIRDRLGILQEIHKHGATIPKYSKRTSYPHILSGHRRGLFRACAFVYGRRH